MTTSRKRTDLADSPQDAPRHAGHVVRRVLLRRNIAIDAETAQLVADAVQAALRAGAPARPPRRSSRRVPPLTVLPCSDPGRSGFAGADRRTMAHLA